MNTIAIDCQTGQIVERLLTSEEIVQIEVEKLKTDAQLAENTAREAAAAAAKESARAKLAALGLTESEISALLGA